MKEILDKYFNWGRRGHLIFLGTKNIKKYEFFGIFLIWARKGDIVQIEALEGGGDRGK